MSLSNSLTANERRLIESDLMADERWMGSVGVFIKSLKSLLVL